MSDDSLQVFADEAEDLLGVAEQALLNIEDLTHVDETIGDLFRTFHTIKGAAGLFGLNNIVEFTHIVENLLGKIREGVVAVDENMISIFLDSRDHLEHLVESALSGEEQLDESLQKVNDTLVEQLNIYLVSPNESSDSSDSSSADNSASTSEPTNPTDMPASGVLSEHWHISLRFGHNALRNGMDPASFISYLSKLGELKNVTLIDDAIPCWNEFDPENCYLGFEISLSALNISKASIEEVFEFVQDDCKISILPPHSQISAYLKMIDDLPEDDLRIGEILVACGALTPGEMDDLLNTQDHLVDEAIGSGLEVQIAPLGEVAVDKKVVEQEVVDAALKKQQVHKQARSNSQQTIRVNALKLESLVNLVGELVIGSANVELNARSLADATLNEAMENLLRLVEEVRDTALGLRMVQIGETFNRYKRVVREVSRDLGKEIDLVISGADTELDKTLIEKIADPLMHLVRNSIDHGIELPEKRKAMGKMETGTVNLDAFHDSGSIVIQIKDDGAGLSKQRILDKALEKGLIQEHQQLTDKEIYRLIFEAGFSTADKVSNLSGRGVGMDVVRRNIESLRGYVEIESEEGQGTTISIRLPLTLAIIEGFQVRVANTQYIIPLDMVEECIELNELLQGSDQQANYINLRGEILPFMHLNELFGTSPEKHEKHRDNIVVVQFAGKKVGFVVDELLGEHQTVIKPLGDVFQNLKGISGATILGSGEVAMIIDIPEMVNRVIKLGQLQANESKAVNSLN